LATSRANTVTVSDEDEFVMFIFAGKGDKSAKEITVN
jgi:hypothetical protein